MMVSGMTAYWLKRMTCPRCGDWNRGESLRSPEVPAAEAAPVACPNCGASCVLRTQIPGQTRRSLPFDQTAVPDFSAPVQTFRLQGRKATGNRRASGRPRGTQKAARNWNNDALV